MWRRLPCPAQPSASATLPRMSSVNAAMQNMGDTGDRGDMGDRWDMWDMKDIGGMWDM